MRSRQSSRERSQLWKAAFDHDVMAPNSGSSPGGERDRLEAAPSLAPLAAAGRTPSAPVYAGDVKLSTSSAAGCKSAASAGSMPATQRKRKISPQTSVVDQVATCSGIWEEARRTAGQHRLCREQRDDHRSRGAEAVEQLVRIGREDQEERGGSTWRLIQRGGVHPHHQARDRGGAERDDEKPRHADGALGKVLRDVHRGQRAVL